MGAARNHLFLVGCRGDGRSRGLTRAESALFDKGSCSLVYVMFPRSRDTLCSVTGRLGWMR